MHISTSISNYFSVYCKKNKGSFLVSVVYTKTGCSPCIHLSDTESGGHVRQLQWIIKCYLTCTLQLIQVTYFTHRLLIVGHKWLLFCSSFSCSSLNENIYITLINFKKQCYQFRILPVIYKTVSWIINVAVFQFYMKFISYKYIFKGPVIHDGHVIMIKTY